MNTKDSNFDNENNEVMKEIGKLDLLTKELNEATAEEEEARQSVSEWITAIGKAILAIFK